MLDMKFLRENPDLVKENIKKKFQDEKLPLVDEVIELDAKNRAAITEASELRASRNARASSKKPKRSRRPSRPTPTAWPSLKSSKRSMSRRSTRSCC